MDFYLDPIVDLGSIATAAVWANKNKTLNGRPSPGRVSVQLTKKISIRNKKNITEKKTYLMDFLPSPPLVVPGRVFAPLCRPGNYDVIKNKLTASIPFFIAIPSFVVNGSEQEKEKFNGKFSAFSFTLLNALSLYSSLNQ